MGNMEFIEKLNRIIDIDNEIIEKIKESSSIWIERHDYLQNKLNAISDCLAEAENFSKEGLIANIKRELGDVNR